MMVKIIEELVAVPASLTNGKVTPIGSTVVSTVGFNVQGSPLTCLAVEHAGRPSCSRDKNMSDPVRGIVHGFYVFETYCFSNITQSNMFVPLPGIVE